MGLEDVQRGLALLLTDETLREQFAADPRSVAQTLDLTAGDAALLENLASAEVERFARSLYAKRWNEIQKLLPVSTRAAQYAGLGLRRLFLRFASSYTPQGGKRHAQDALAFAGWAARQPEETFHQWGRNAVEDKNGANAVWLPDLLRYEAAWLEMQMRPSRRWMLRRFAYPVPALARAVSLAGSHDMAGSGFAPFLSAPQPVFVCWLRWRTTSRLRDYTLPLRVRRRTAKLGKLTA